VTAGTGIQDDVRALIDRALEVYRDEPAAVARLRAHRRRLDEPLRVALVGRVKAGKSTLLNALVGARLAPTDAGECTRVVTWFRNGALPQVALHEVDGSARVLPVRRIDGGLRLDLGGTPPERVERLVVDWPAEGLASATLIDTPGLASLTDDASARTQAFLEDDPGPGADAILFLTRQMQAEDLAFLTEFRAAVGEHGQHTSTITVLSRADEVGSGRLDALVVADQVARRTAEKPAVRAVTQALVPVAGLLGLAGRTLRHRDFVALRSLEQGDRADLESMLLSADRFCRPEAPIPVAQAARVDLLDRLGLFGVRLGVALIRLGAADAGALAAELVRRSGLAELQRLLDVHFTRRSGALKAATALRGVERLLAEMPISGTEPLRAGIERIQVASPELPELDLLMRLRSPRAPLPAGWRREAERLLGAEGAAATDRLGLRAAAADEDLRAAAVEALTRWRARAGDPLTTRAAVDACDLLARTCEEILGRLDGLLSAAVFAEPGPGGSAEQGEQGQHDETALH
jgi:hypothetical protein